MVELQEKENIIFDLGGVLLNIDYDRTARAFKGLGLDSFDSIYSQREQSVLFDGLEVGRISSEEFVEKLMDRIPKASRTEIINAWNAMLLDLPGHRLELLDKLKDDYRIFLLSNTNQIHEDAFLQIIENTYASNVLFEKFEEVYLSHRIGLRKPTKECFKFVLDQHDLTPEKTLFIDDSIQHIEGANTVGIDTFHLKKGIDITTLFPDKFQRASH